MPRGKPSDKTLSLRYPLEYDPKLNAIVTRMPEATWVFPGSFELVDENTIRMKRKKRARR